MLKYIRKVANNNRQTSTDAPTLCANCVTIVVISTTSVNKPDTPVVHSQHGNHCGTVLV